MRFAPSHVCVGVVLKAYEVIDGLGHWPELILSVRLRRTLQRTKIVFISGSLPKEGAYPKRPFLEVR